MSTPRPPSRAAIATVALVLAAMACSSTVTGGGGSGGSGGSAGSGGCGPMPGAIDCATCTGGFTSPICSNGHWTCAPLDCGPCGPLAWPATCENPCTSETVALVCEGTAWTCPVPETCPGAARWSKAFANATEADLAVGPGGTIAVVGAFADTVDFGDGPHVAAGDSDAFVVLFDADGVPLWSQTFGGGPSAGAGSVAMLPDGRLAVCGRFDGTTTFGATSLTSQGAADQFVGVLDAGGLPLWAKRFDARACTVEVDPDDNLVLAGYFGDSIDLDPLDLGGGPVPSSGHADIYVAKLTAAGDHLWTRTFAGSLYDYANDVAVSTAGDVAVVGTFRGALDLGGGTLTTNGAIDAFDAFAFTLDADGNHLSSFAFGGPDHDTASSVAFGPGGELLIAAAFHGTVTLGNETFVVSGADPSDADGLIVVASPDGTTLQATQIAGASDVIHGWDGFEVCAPPPGASSDFLIGGGFTQALDVGGATATSHGDYDVAIARRGASAWSLNHYGDEYADILTALAWTPTQRVVATGHFWGGTDFGAGPPGLGSNRMFLAEFPAP